MKTNRDILNPQLDLSERLFLVILQFRKRHLHNTTFERVIGILCAGSAVLPIWVKRQLLTQTLRSVDKCLADLGVLEKGRCFDVVPVCISDKRIVEQMRTNEEKTHPSADIPPSTREKSNAPFLVKGSTTFFLIPFFPFESLLFLPTAML